MTDNLNSLKNSDQKSRIIDKTGEENNDNNNSQHSNFPMKNVILTLSIIILLLSSFFISAIISSRNYEGIFNFITNKVL